MCNTITTHTTFCIPDAFINITKYSWINIKCIDDKTRFQVGLAIQNCWAMIDKTTRKYFAKISVILCKQDMSMPECVYFSWNWQIFSINQNRHCYEFTVFVANRIYFICGIDRLLYHILFENIEIPFFNFPIQGLYFCNACLKRCLNVSRLSGLYNWWFHDFSPWEFALPGD